jgi:hypothetical protein
MRLWLALGLFAHCALSDELAPGLSAHDREYHELRPTTMHAASWRAKAFQRLALASAKLEMLAAHPSPCPDDYVADASWAYDRWGLATRNIISTVTPRGLLEGHLLQSFDNPAEMEVALNHGAVDLTAPPTDSPPPTAIPTSYPTYAPKAASGDSSA